MIYVLMGLLILFLWVSFSFGGKDFFSPATVQILTFSGSIMMCIYFMWSMNAPYEFHWKTIVIIASAMGITSLIGIIIHFYFTKMGIHAYMPESVDISPISGAVTLFFGGIILFTIVWLLVEIRRIGGTADSFFETMNRFHAINSYSTERIGRLPWILNQLLSLLRVLFLIFGFNLIRFYNILTVYQKCANLFILGLCCLALLMTGGRTPAINQLICCFMMFHLFRIQKEGRYKKYRFKSLIHIAFLLIMVMYFFFMVKSFVGRGTNNTMSPADYISYYTGTQYIVLDQYFQHPPYTSSIIGKETFYSFIQFLINYKVIDIPAYIVHLEFRPVGAGFRTNVYTFLRSYHYDFGLAGMYILHSLSILFLSVFYEFVKKRRGNIGILIFSQMYYTIVMSFFAERFYSTIFSMNYIKLLVMLLLLYEILIRKRIRFKLHRTTYTPKRISFYDESRIIDS